MHVHVHACTVFLNTHVHVFFLKKSDRYILRSAYFLLNKHVNISCTLLRGVWCYNLNLYTNDMVFAV